MPARKRKSPETPEAGGSRRRSLRVTPASKKSKYFESDPEDEDDSDVAPSSKKKTSKGLSSKPKSAGKKKKQVELDDEDEDDDVYQEEPDADDDDEQNGKEEDSDDEFDEDAPPKVKFIPLPKLRDTGGIEYADDTVHPNTMLFLKDLKANNQRDWLKSHDKEYRRTLKDWESFVESFTEKLTEADETIPELPVKDVIFRIYRDIRFSNDPTPYKPHYSAAWSRTGRKGPYACYYVHCEPGKCMVGGGLWHPENGAVAQLRASIDERPQRWRRVLMDPDFRRTFLPKAKSGDEKAVLKAFAESNAEGALKTKPKGFIAEHRDIELLKLKSYTVGKKVPDSVFTDADGQEQLLAIIRPMVPFITFLNRLVMPDPDDDDEDSDEEEDNE